MRYSASTVLREDWAAAVREGLGHYAAFELASPAPRLPGSPAELRALARLRDRHGLAYSVHAPFRDLDPAAEEPALRRRTARLYAAALTTAAAVGAEVVVMHPATVSLAQWRAMGDRRRAEVRRREVDAFHAATSLAARLGVRVAVENMPVFRAARDVTWLEHILDAVRSPWLGCTVDVGHAHCAGIPPALLMAHLGPRLWHVHVHDNSGEGDQHRALGEGSVDWVSVAAALVALDYRGLVVDESLDLAAQLRGGPRLRRLVERARLSAEPPHPGRGASGAAN